MTSAFFMYTPQFDCRSGLKHAKPYLLIDGHPISHRGDVGDEDGVDVAQGVHDALDRDASQRPAAERNGEALAREIDCLGGVDGEADPLALLARHFGARRRHVLGVGIERVDRPGTLGGEGRQPTFAAADVLLRSGGATTSIRFVVRSEGTAGPRDH